VTPQQAANGVTLAGDAAHPMTPNLAQGGCTSLEDAVILTRKLCEALRTGKEEEDLSVVARRIGSALTEYESERWARTFRLTVKSFVFGSLLAWDSSLICFLRDNVALPVAFRASVVFGSSKFDCGDLPPPLD
jgi:2-polyprenyl-6-methoxyphenol hydroxylase-like FAD-dependent oxidoreductase